MIQIVKSRHRLALFLVLLVVITGIASKAVEASITTYGSISPNYDNSDPWYVYSNLNVGTSSNGSLIISDGSSVVNSLFGRVGVNVGGTGTVNVIGEDSSLNSQQHLYIGYSGNGNMTVSEGGYVRSYAGLIGRFGSSTGYVEVTGPDSKWYSLTDLYIGSYGNGEAKISNGGKIVTDDLAYIGHYEGSVGNLLVTGVGSRFYNRFTMTVGNFGTGSMTIENGASVGSGTASIGEGSTGWGTVTVDGLGSLWEITGSLNVGYAGSGELNISDGGTVTNTKGYIGFGTNSVGDVNVSEADSLWQNSDNLYIGYYGTGNMTISNGGKVTDVNSFLGYLTDSTADVTVTGAGSLWENTNDLDVGHNGNASVVISEGGKITNYNGYLGYRSNGYGSMLVTGEGSLWENSNDVHIGYFGEGDMKISDGGSVSNLYSYLGYFRGSKGEATVSGPNAVWNTLNHLYVGFEGEGEVMISEGGKVTSSVGYIGVLGNSTGLVTVTGADSLWENSDTLLIGHESDGTMKISDGGKVTSTESYIGHTSSGTGNVSVDGIDSLWENSGNLYVGYEGVGNMTISHSGKVTDANAFIGYEANSIGSVNVSVADVNAPHPTWENSGNLFVGYKGTGDMTISEGGKVTDSNAYIGYGRFSTGTVTVTGTDSLWQSSENLYVAYDGTGSMTISDGGKVMSKNSYVGYDVNSIADVNVAGTGSLWQNSENLYVGYRSASDMIISNGGTVTALDSYIGYATGSEGSSVTVTGTDSQWANSENLYVGYTSSGDMTVSNGGTVTGTNAYIGYEINSVGAVTVNEPNSLWENSENLYVAYRGTGDLNISDGGKVKGANAYIGYEANSLGTVTVSEPNALWENSENLYVGYGSNGSMNISGSGKVTDANAYIGYKANSTGSVSVTDVNSLWENSENLYVGYSGTGDMTISNHATVMDTNAYVGYNAGSFGTVTVSGPDSVWESTGNLYIGGNDTGSGGSALLNVKDEGVVQAGNITNWSTGTIMGDGTLKADNLTNKGVIKPGNSIGTLTIDGDMTIDTGSILEVEFETSGESDKLLVTGDLDILGGKVKALASGTAIGSKEYTIIEANSVTGTFDLLETVLLDVTLGYEPNSVLMNITAMPFDDPSLALTNNQKELGSALQQIANRGGNSVTAALQRLDSLGELSSVYNQLAGLSRLSLAPATIAGTSKFTNTVASRFQNLRLGIAKESGNSRLFAMAKSLESFGQTNTTDANPGPYNYAFGNGTSFFNDNLWGIWCKGYGVFGDRDAEGSDAPGFDYSVKGAAFGLDYQLNKRLIVGITGGFSNGDVDYTSSKDESEISSTAIGVYATLNTNNWYVDTILNFSDLEYETKRHIDMTSEKLTGTFDGLEITGYIEGGYNKHFGKTWILQPSASLQFTYLDQDGYKEKGGPSALNFKAQDYESIQSSVGAKLIKRLDKNKSDGVCSVIELRGRYVYDLGDTESQVDASFASDPGTVFTISDEGVARDSMVFGIGFHSEINDNTKLFIDYDTTFNSDQNYHIISGGFQHRW